MAEYEARVKHITANGNTATRTVNVTAESEISARRLGGNKLKSMTSNRREARAASVRRL
jgi:hypothetical protein